MAKDRLPMRKTREILRLQWAQSRSVRETAASVGTSTGVIDKFDAAMSTGTPAKISARHAA